MQLRSIALASVLLSIASTAHAGCFVGGSVGANLSTPTINGGIASLGVDTRTVLAAPEVGCDLSLGRSVSIGAVARYDFASYSGGQIATLDSLKASGSYSVLFTPSLAINKNARLYAMAGITGTDFSLNGIGTQANGTTFGAGMELNLENTKWSVFAEADVTSYGYRTISGVSAKPDSDVFRIGLRYRPDFGSEMAYAPLK